MATVYFIAKHCTVLFSKRKKQKELHNKHSALKVKIKKAFKVIFFKYESLIRFIYHETQVLPMCVDCNNTTEGFKQQSNFCKKLINWR